MPEVSNVFGGWQSKLQPRYGFRQAKHSIYSDQPLWYVNLFTLVDHAVYPLCSGVTWHNSSNQRCNNMVWALIQIVKLLCVQFISYPSNQVRYHTSGGRSGNSVAMQHDCLLPNISMEDLAHAWKQFELVVTANTVGRCKASNHAAEYVRRKVDWEIHLSGHSWPKD